MTKIVELHNGIIKSFRCENSKTPKQLSKHFANDALVLYNYAGTVSLQFGGKLYIVKNKASHTVLNRFYNTNTAIKI